MHPQTSSQHTLTSTNGCSATKSTFRNNFLRSIILCQTFLIFFRSGNSTFPYLQSNPCWHDDFTTIAEISNGHKQPAILTVDDSTVDDSISCGTSDFCTDNSSFLTGSSKSHTSSISLSSTSGDDLQTPSSIAIQKIKPYHVGKSTKRKHSMISLDQNLETAISTKQPLSVEEINGICQNVLTGIMNKVNQGDATALKELLVAHCDPSIETTFMYKNASETCPYSQSTHIEIHGASAIALFCETILVAIPDTRMTTQETHCRAQNSGIVVLSSRYAFTGTKTLSLITDQCNCIIKSAANDYHPDYIRAYHHKTRHDNKGRMDSPYHEGRLIVGAKPQPQSLKLFGAIQMTMNPYTGLITKLHVTHSHKKR